MRNSWTKEPHWNTIDSLNSSVSVCTANTGKHNRDINLSFYNSINKNKKRQQAITEMYQEWEWEIGTLSKCWIWVIFGEKHMHGHNLIPRENRELKDIHT